MKTTATPKDLEDIAKVLEALSPSYEDEYLKDIVEKQDTEAINEFILNGFEKYSKMTNQELLTNTTINSLLLITRLALVGLNHCESPDCGLAIKVSSKISKVINELMPFYLVVKLAE